jgi:hypothetical protein
MPSPPGTPPACTDLRAAFVGGGDEGITGLQHLPSGGPRIQPGPAAAQPERPLHGHVQGQQSRREAAVAVRKVLPPGRVRDPGQIGAVLKAGTQPAFVLPAHGIARTSGQTIVRQPVQLHRAAVAGLQVAELGVQPRPAPGDDARRQRCIAVGRDVPVVGHRQLQAAAVVQIDGGRQPARLARIVEREAQAGQGQDGQAQEAQHRAFGDALVGVEVHLDAAHAQLPIRLVAGAQRAAGVRRLGRTRSGVAQEVDAVGPAAGAHAQELEGRRQKVAFKALHVQHQLGPGIDRAFAADPDLPQAVRAVLRCVVAQAVGLHHQSATAELDFTFGPGQQVGLPADLVRLQHDGQLPPRIATGQRLQHGAGLQRRARTPARPALDTGAASAARPRRSRRDTRPPGPAQPGAGGKGRSRKMGLAQADL